MITVGMIEAAVGGELTAVRFEMTSSSGLNYNLSRREREYYVPV